MPFASACEDHRVDGIITKELPRQLKIVAHIDQ